MKAKKRTLGLGSCFLGSFLFWNNFAFTNHVPCGFEAQQIYTETQKKINGPKRKLENQNQIMFLSSFTKNSLANHNIC